MKGLLSSLCTWSISSRGFLLKFLILQVIFKLGLPTVVGEVDNGGNERGEPRHTDIVQNVTVVQGRDAILSCHVENVEAYKIAWVRVKTQTILSLNTKLISRNHRFEVSTTDRKEWNLKIKSVKPSDRGWYMCQINTDPMKSQTGYLEITQSPRILSSGTSTDLTINEGYPARLTCYASGHPMPTITWKREDGKSISKRRISGSDITFPSVTREDHGAYLCIANNNVPPAISRRIILNVLFAPEVHMDVRLAQKPLGERVILNATARGNPPPTIRWKRDGREIQGGNERHIISTQFQSTGLVFTSLEIISLEKEDDYVQYTCEASNSKGTIFDSLEIHVLDDIVLDDNSETRNEVFYGSSSHTKKESKSQKMQKKINQEMKINTNAESNTVYSDPQSPHSSGNNDETTSRKDREFVPKSMRSSAGPAFDFMSLNVVLLHILFIRSIALF